MYNIEKKMSSLNQTVTMLGINKKIPDDAYNLSLYKPLTRVRASVIHISENHQKRKSIAVTIKNISPKSSNMKFCGIMWKGEIYDIKTPFIPRGKQFSQFIAQENPY